MLRKRLKRFVLLWFALAAVALPALLVYHVLIGGASPWLVIIGWAVIFAWGLLFGIPFVWWFARIERRRQE